MKKMSKKKKIIYSISAVFLALVIIALVLLAVFYPYIRLINKLHEVAREDIDFTVEGRVTGLGEFIAGTDEISGKISGTKTKDGMYANIKYEDKSYMEIYMDDEYNMVFNLHSLFDRYVDKLDSKSRLSLNAIKKISPNMYVSLDQLEYIVGKDIITINDTGITSDFFSDIKFNDSKYSIKRISKKDSFDSHLDDDAYYFEINIKNKGTKAILGIPRAKSDTRIYLNITYSDMNWELNIVYQPIEYVRLDIPKETFGETTISIIKTLYEKIMSMR